MCGVMSEISAHGVKDGQKANTETNGSSISYDPPGNEVLIQC